MVFDRDAVLGLRDVHRRPGDGRAGRVPVLSMIPEIVTAGEDTAVVATGISFESNAHLAAIYGADILMGRAKAGDLKVTQLVDVNKGIHMMLPKTAYNAR